MDPTDAQVTMLCTDPHPAHRGFADAIDAQCIDFQHRSLGPLDDSLAADVVNGLTYPAADVYLVEGSQPLYAALVARLTRGTPIVYLCADHGLYELGHGDFEGQSTLKSLVGRFGQPLISQVAHRGIDGVIAVSEFAAEFTRPIVGPPTPMRVAHPYVQPAVFDRLQAVSPAVDGATVVTVARGDRYKGVDMLVDAWPTVRDQHPEATLHIVGAGHPETYETTAGVQVRGFVDDLAAALANGALFVQPSRMDTFPVATLEAMCAGLPPLVTSTTGTRSVARAIDPSLVVDPTPTALAAGISRYLDRNVVTRRAFSTRSRAHGETFDEATRTAAFRQAFHELLDEL